MMKAFSDIGGESVDGVVDADKVEGPVEPFVLENV